jgi:hypothetical protein
MEEELIQPLNAGRVTRLEVINHANNKHKMGRILTLYKEMEDFEHIEVVFQDGGKTLKIFLG